jgi:hypothetical protein
MFEWWSLNKTVEAKLMMGAGGDIDAARQDIILQVKGAIQPFIALVARLSDTKADPGGLIVKRVAQLEAQVVLLTATTAPPTMAAAPATSSGVSLAWTIPASTPPPPPPTFPQPSAGPAAGAMAQLQNTVTGLERKVTALENQPEGNSIDVAGYEFTSAQDAISWIKTHAPEDGSHAFFLDSHGLMTLGFGRGITTTQEVFKMDEFKEKLKYASIDAALLTAAFQIAIPEFFGVKAGDKSAKTLPGLPKSTDWDAKDGDRGLRYDITRKCLAVYTDRMKNTRSSLSPIASLVAITMLVEAHKFVTLLVSWINSFLGDRANKGDNKQEMIKHVSHAVHTVMGMLHAARGPGRGAFGPGEMPGKLLWGTLQAIGVMRELREANFSSHPALSHILNLHLQENVVTKAEMGEMREKLKSVLDEVTKMKSAFDRAVGANKKKTPS